MPDPLDTPATLSTLRRLHAEGLLNEEAFRAAERTLRPAGAWLDWIRRTLLLTGSALVLAGVIYFFAYNWAAMGRFLKFGLIEAGIAGCVLAGYRRGLDRLSSRILLLGAAVLVGVLLAVYGQVYQTGADAFALFTGWALLIAGWVLASRFAPLWFVWLLLLDLAVLLYWQQVASPVYRTPYGLLCLALTALNGGMLALRELGLRSGRAWLEGAWLRDTLFVFALTPLLIPVIHLLVDPESADRMTVLAAGAWAVAAAGGYYCYRRPLPDMTPLAVVVAHLCLVVLTGTGKGILTLLERAGLGSEMMPLPMALVTLAVVAGAVVWLRKTAVLMADEQGEAA
jgi:uncharacterized membrane protein